MDRSFVVGVDAGFRERSICGAMIDMAAGMQMDVIAEGVETQSQYLFLKEKHCNEAQGYLLSWPLDLEQAECFLRQASTPNGIPLRSFAGTIKGLTSPYSPGVYTVAANERGLVDTSTSPLSFTSPRQDTLQASGAHLFKSSTST
ncbi:MAG: EAL domain-containing protein [Syntrophotaleaceae bacterium]